MDQPLPQENDPQQINEGFLDGNDPDVKRDSEKRGSAQQFLDSLSKMESNYCRAKSTKNYLEPNWESKSQLHREYTRWCEERNIGFFAPKNDQCKTWIKFKLGKVTEEEQASNYKNEGARDEDRHERKKDKKKKLL